jgi:hypothetical protein
MPLNLSYREPQSWLCNIDKASFVIPKKPWRRLDLTAEDGVDNQAFSIFSGTLQRQF